MVELSEREGDELRELLRRLPSARSAEETIAVSANANTSVTFTRAQTVVVLDVLARAINEMGREEIGQGLSRLRDALTGDLGCE